MSYAVGQVLNYLNHLSLTGNQNQVIGQVTGGKVVGDVTGNVTL